MRTDRPLRFSFRLPGVKPGEEGVGFLFFAYFFLVTAPFSIFKSIRDASYLNELGSENLPLAYATAFFVGLVVAFQAKLQGRVRRDLLLAVTLIFFALSGAAFALLFPRSGKWLALAYWVWANILVVVLMTQFWITFNDVFNPREAKRLIGFIGSGGILGGILGGLLTGLLARKMSYGVLWLGSGMLLAGVLSVRLLFTWMGRHRPASEVRPSGLDGCTSGEGKVGFKVCLDTVRRDPYLRLLAGIVILTGLISTFIDWQSKHVIERTVRSNLASFFGLFNAGLLVFSFLLQLLGTSRLVGRYGIRRILLFYPAVILLCTVGIAVWPVLGLAVALKGSDKSLSYSVNQSARELLYFPVPVERKYQAKTFIDMFLNRFSKTMGALLLLAVFALPWLPGLQTVSLLAIFCLAVWIGLNFKASSEYVRIVKEKLRGRWDRGDRLVQEKMDPGFAKAVFDLVESRSRSPELFALHVFDLIRQKKLTPEVRALLLAEPEDRRPASWGGLFESEAAGPLEQVGADLEKMTLEQNVREIVNLDVYQEVMQGFVERTLEERRASSTVARMEIAKMLGLMPPRSRLAWRLEDLLQDDSAEVVRYAIDSAGCLGRRDFIAYLVQHLSNPRLEQDAVDALEKYGARITGTLADFLADPAQPLVLRKKITGLLGQIGNQEAADFLLWELGRNQEDMEDDLIDALDRARSGEERIRFDLPLVMNKLGREIRRYYQTYLAESKAGRDQRSLAGDPDRARTLETILLNIFKLLGLVYPREDVFKAYKNWLSGTREAVAYALELLENSLNKDVRDVLFLILEDYPPQEKVRRFRSLLKNFPEFES